MRHSRDTDSGPRALRSRLRRLALAGAVAGSLAAVTMGMAAPAQANGLLELTRNGNTFTWSPDAPVQTEFVICAPDTVVITDCTQSWGPGPKALYWFSVNGLTSTTLSVGQDVTGAGFTTVQLPAGDYVFMVARQDGVNSQLLSGSLQPDGTPPPSWYQSYARPSADSTCDAGWTASWAQWPHDGTGGWVCNREEFWNVATGGWAFRSRGARSYA